MAEVCGRANGSLHGGEELERRKRPCPTASLEGTLQTRSPCYAYQLKVLLHCCSTQCEEQIFNTWATGAILHSRTNGAVLSRLLG